MAEEETSSCNAAQNDNRPFYYDT